MARRRRIPGTFDRRGDTIRVRLRVAGERYTYTVETTDRRAAERFAVTKAQELERSAARRAAGLTIGTRFSALLEHFERVELPALAVGASDAYRDSFKPIREYFVETIGDPTVESIQARHVSEYLAWRRVHRFAGNNTAKQKTSNDSEASENREKQSPKPVSNRTLQKDRAVLHRMFAIADRLEYRDGNPVARTPMPKADPRDPVILTDDQFEALLTQCIDRPMLALYVLLLGETGLRCESEALRLTWEDVDIEGGFIRVASGRNGHRTKSGKGRWVPMTPRLTSAMRRHFVAYRAAEYDGKTTPWIFHHDHTYQRHAAGTRVQCLRAAFQSAAKRAKLPPELRQHDLRHRRVTTWLAHGKSATLVKEAMGHSDLRVTMAYTHLAREHLRDLIDQPGPVLAVVAKPA